MSLLQTVPTGWTRLIKSQEPDLLADIVIHVAYLDLVLKLNLEKTQSPLSLLIALIKVIGWRGRRLQKGRLMLCAAVPAEAGTSLTEYGIVIAKGTHHRENR